MPEPSEVPWLALGFCTGLLCGLLLKEAGRLVRGQEDEMDRLRAWRQRNADRIIWAAFALSLALNGIVGVIVMASNGDRVALTQCLSEYNAKVGQARDERTAAASAVSQAEISYVQADIRYQQGLLSELQGDTDYRGLTDVVADRLRDNQAYLKRLDASRKVTLENQYPSPDFCETP